MLTSRKLKGDPEATANYHMGEENYYFSQASDSESLASDETPATQDHVRIHGALAAHLGFSDGQAITREQFSHVLGGKDASGNKVTRRHTVHGIDLTFSAPKSVSVAALLTHRDTRILKAHEQAVLETMREIERACAAAQPRPGECAPTGNLAYVTALDGFNRDHEPHIHTHVVVTNMTLYEGRVLALDGREIMARGFNRMWGTMYKTKLAAKLKDLGYGVTYMKKGEFRLDAVSLEVEKAFSGRRAEILEAKERGLRDMQAWDSTRKKKDSSVVKEDVLAAWERKLDEFEEKAPEVNRTEAVAERQRWYKEANWSVEAKQELAGNRETGEIGRWQLAMQRATQSAASVSEQEIIGEYLTELGRTETWNPITYAESQRAFRVQVQAGHIVATDAGYYTSWELMRADRECVELHVPAARLALPQGGAESSLEAYKEASVEAGRRPLSERQVAAAVGILASGRGTDVVQGDAGSGKTTMLRAVNTVAAKAGWDVAGVAIQGVAARNLQDESGIRSTTLAAYLAQEMAAESRGIHRAPRLVVFDEASMLGSRDGARFLRLSARHGDKVVLVGDRNQIQSVGAGKPFERLVEAAEASGQLLSLHDNWRQRNPVLRSAVDMARQGRMRQSLDLLEDKGFVLEVPDAVMRRTLIAKLYSENTLIMAGTQDSCEDLNRRIRQNLAARGGLDAKTEREFKLSWRDGDGVRQTSYRNLAVGERIRFLQNDYRDHLDVRNGECGRIEKLGDRSLDIRHDDGRLLRIDLAKYDAIDYGYAVTTYKGQGQTFDRVLVEADTALPYLQDQRNSYVQITRARDEVRIFTDDSEELRQIAGILSSKRDTLHLKPTIEDARRMEAHVGKIARQETPVWGREAEAFGRSAAEAIERAATKGETMAEKGADSNDDRKRDDVSSEPSSPPTRPDPTPGNGGPAPQGIAGQTPASLPVPASLPSSFSSFDSSITANVRNFNALFGEVELSGSAERLRKELRKAALDNPAKSRDEIVGDRLKLLATSIDGFVSGYKHAFKFPANNRAIVLENFRRDVERRLMLANEVPTKEMHEAFEAVRQSIRMEAGLEPDWTEKAAEKPSAESTPQSAAIRIEDRYLIEAAGGSREIEEVILADAKALEERINSRTDLSRNDKERLAEFFGRPGTAELFFSGTKPNAMIIAAEVALEIRSKEDAYSKLSKDEVQAAQRCARIIAESASAAEQDEGQRPDKEIDGPDLEL